MVFVLLLGEIDLSIGYVSGACGSTALFLLPDDNPSTASGRSSGLAATAPRLVAIVFAVIIGAASARPRPDHRQAPMPSFVATLAALLVWQGMVLLLIGGRGTIILQNYVVTDVANKFL